MFCPQCHAEYREGFYQCSGCHVPLVYRLPEAVKRGDSSIDAHEEPGEDTLDFLAGEGDLNAFIRTGLVDPIAISLARSLLQEARIPFFEMDQNVVARQESGNILGWWSIRVPEEKDAEAREILRSVAEMDR